MLTPRQQLKQRGATLVLTALAMSALLGAAALAIDLGTMRLAKQQAQDLADAAALAGGANLPNESAALSSANEILAVNQQDGAALLDVSITFPQIFIKDDGSSVDAPQGNALMVSGYVDAPIAFGAAVGFSPTADNGTKDSASVPAEAGTLIQNLCTLPAGVGLAPFGIVGNDPGSSDPVTQFVSNELLTNSGNNAPQPGVYQPIRTYNGEPLTLKLNVYSSAGKLLEPGNMDALSFTTPSGYENSIRQVSASPLSAGQNVNVDLSATPDLTQQGLAARLAPSNTEFTHDFPVSPAYQDWFFGNPSDPIDASLPSVVDSVTGKSYSYHLDPNRQNIGDGHLLIVPIIDAPSDVASAPVAINAFAVFFVEEPFNSIDEPYTNAIAQGRFIGMTIPNGQSGGCAAVGVDLPAELMR